MKSDTHTDSQTQDQCQETGTDGNKVTRRIRYGIDYRLHVEPHGLPGTDPEECNQARQDPRGDCQKDHFSPNYERWEARYVPILAFVRGVGWKVFRA